MPRGIARLLVDAVALVGLLGGLAPFVPTHQPRQDVALLERLASTAEQGAAAPQGAAGHRPGAADRHTAHQ